MGLAFVNDEFVEENSPIFGAKNRILMYGDGFFESIKVSSGVVLHFNLHYDRIIKSLMLLQMDPKEDWSQIYFEDNIIKLCKKNNFENARIRMVFYRDTDGYYTPESNEASFFMTADKLEQSNYPFKRIKNLDIYKEMYKTTNFTSVLKTTSANIYVMASLFAKKNGYGDCLLINEKDYICEATSSNVFLVKGNQIVTPPISQYCVNGIMRNVVLQLAESYGYTYQESIIEEQDLYLADELFLTNAIQGIMPVSDFRGKEYSFAYTDVLLKLLNDSIKQNK